MTYAYAAVCAASDEMHVVELERSDWAGVPDEAAVNLSASQVPEANHAVCSSAC
jgi:hypothetical protein